MHRISDTRIGGIAKRNLTLFRKLCGESSLKNVVIVTNMWTENASEAIATLEAKRELELATNDQFFKRALDNGARMTRHNGTAESAHAIIRPMLKAKPQPLQIQRELVDDHTPLMQTEAGTQLRDEWKEVSDRHRREVEELKEQHRREIEELKAANAQIIEQLRLEQEQRKQDVKALKDAVQEMTRAIGETAESLEDAREKLTQIVQQTQMLSKTKSESDERMNAVAKKMEDEIKAVRRQMSRADLAEPENVAGRRERRPMRSNTTPARMESGVSAGRQFNVDGSSGGSQTMHRRIWGYAAYFLSLM